jgi:hypothetical protein
MLKARNALVIVAAWPLLLGCPPSGGTQGDAGDGPPTAVVATNGFWSGDIAYGDASAPIEFLISVDAGSLSGQQILVDPLSQAAIETGPISGTATMQGAATWNTLGNGLAVQGAFSGSRFTGSAILAARGGGSVSASISLVRLEGGAP